MKPILRTILLSTIGLLSCGTLLALMVEARSRPGTVAAGSVDDKASLDKASGVQDEPLAAFQGELLDLAFRTASALPLKPHVKRRSRAQEAVAETCFELDQPRRALRYVEQIANWRRGAGYARLALYGAQHGETAEVQHYLDLALEVSEKAESEGAQDWQRGRIRAGIANTYLWLGQAEKAAALEAGIADFDTGRLEATKAGRLEADALEERIQAVEAAVATNQFDDVRNALETSSWLFDRFYMDEERRSRLEELIKTSWTKLPVMIRIELMMNLAGSALQHEDRSGALDLVQEARVIVDDSKWRPEDQLAVTGRLARIRSLAGDPERARSEVEAAIAMFDRDREQIIDIYRAGALRPLAEAYQAIGDPAAALVLYKRAVEEGVQNINSRPRAEDLSATCCSMALHAVEPDAELRTKMTKICDGLGDPW